MATSKDESAREGVAAPGLETRRTHEVTATSEDPRRSIDKRSEPDAPAANVAVYLIEREAIQLRRLRWAPRTEMLRGPDDGDTRERTIRPGNKAAPERLTPYTRPEPSSPSSRKADDVIGRLQSWLRQIFGRE
jgi:hypothetical protein